MGHWYGVNGEPVYTVPRATGGGERDTNITDARKLKLVPSVTSILAILDKPALTMWLQNETMEAAIRSPFFSEWDDQADWKRRIKQDASRKSREAAEKGDQIHNALEQYYLGNHRKVDIAPELAPFCIPVINFIEKEFGRVAWVSEASFMHPKGFGGKCDLHLKPCGSHPKGVVLDFKTKSTEDFSKVKAYFEQAMQVVAYREGFNIPKADCYDLFISTQNPNTMLLHKWDEQENKRAWECFQHLVHVWQLLNKFSLTHE